MAVVLVAVIVLSVGAGSASAITSWPVPRPDQSQWFNFDKDLKDPTLTYTQVVSCKSFTPSGQATLYPYNVPEGPDVPGYRWAYRNDSTSGVTVRVETAVSGASTTSVGFEVTSLHIGGDYAFKVSLECQSLYPDANATISTPTVSDIGPNGAVIHVTFARGLFVNGQDCSYYVQYGTKPAVYDHQTARVSEDLPDKGGTDQSIRLLGLTPGTTYHYRVALQQGLQAPSYSGADQQFGTTGALGGRVQQQSRLVTIAPERASSLRLTAPTLAGRRVFLRRPAGTALQYWTVADAGTGARINLINARTGLCLEVSRASPAVITNRCRPGAKREQWRQVRSAAGRWWFVNAQTGEALTAQINRRRVLQGKAAASASWTTTSVTGLP